MRLIDGDGDLMHHKFAVRDGAALWCGSTNWTLDSWTREENVIVTAVSQPLAQAYERAFEELWQRRHIEDTGDFDAPVVRVGDARVRPWFCPGRGRELAHRIATRIDRARQRIRIASPVLTSAPVLAALAEVLHEGRVSATGVVDITQTEQALRAVARQRAGELEGAGARGGARRAWSSTASARSRTRPDSAHDFMHAKISVIDDVVFVGLLQPLALGRGERRERARDRGPRARRPDRLVDRRRPRALPGRALSDEPALLPRAVQRDGDDVARVLPDLEQVELGGLQHPARDGLLAQPGRAARTSSRRPRGSPGSAATLSVMMRLSASNSSSSVP